MVKYTFNTTTAKMSVKMYHEAFPFKYPFGDFIKERRGIVFGMMDQKIPVMEGAAEFIEQCFGLGLNLAIATSAPHRPRMPKILRALNASDYISVFVTGDEIKRQKPFPDIFLLTAEKLGVNPQECLVLEDAPAGVEAGKAARMRTFGVNEDEATRRALRDSGADEVFSSLAEINMNKL